MTRGGASGMRNPKIGFRMLGSLRVKLANCRHTTKYVSQQLAFSDQLRWAYFVKAYFGCGKHNTHAGIQKMDACIFARFTRKMLAGCNGIIRSIEILKYPAIIWTSRA